MSAGAATHRPPRGCARWTAALDAALTAALALAMGALALGLHAWDWRLPYRYDHDALLMLAMLKTFLETGD